MKILFVTSHVYMPQIYGGLQMTNRQVCLSLKQKGHTVVLLAGLTRDGTFGLKARIKLHLNNLIFGHKLALDHTQGYKIWRTWFPWKEVRYVAKVEKPDLIVVVSGDTTRTALEAKKTGIPVMLSLHDVEFHLHGGSLHELGKIPAIANSQFTASRYREAFGLDPVVVYPLVATEKYKTPTTRENITFINPHPQKGVDIALFIAKHCPEIPFTFVSGWPLTPVDQANLDNALTSLPNVTLIAGQKDMRIVYSKCKILLVPSRWEETYGRVATEAQASGIPVLASNRGGLPEAVGPGGILLDPDAPIETWVAMVKKLWTDTDYYNTLSTAAVSYAARPEITGQYQADTLEKAMIATAKNPEDKR